MFSRIHLRLRSALRLILALAGAASLAAAAAETACHAVSAPEQATLVELFTSDGCSSCPPANAWLSSVLAQGRSSIIPVSLHVTYWNYLGWRDAFSAAFFDQRQDWYAQRASNRFPYTPELIRNGQEWQGWRNGGDARPQTAARAPVSLDVALRQAAGDTLDVQVAIRELSPGAVPHPADSQLLVYLYQDGVAQHPDAGELRGALLRHDHVVRAWQAIDQPAFGTPQLVHLAQPPEADRSATGVVAFLQDRRSGAVLQALDLHYCRP